MNASSHRFVNHDVDFIDFPCLPIDQRSIRGGRNCENVMRIHSFLVVAALAGIGLASCAGGSGQTSKRLGLTSGPLPTPQPFVTQSRASQPDVYPRIGALPPPRSDQILSMNDRKALEASLLATPGRQPSPEELKARAQANRKVAHKRVSPSQRKHVGFFPPQ